MTEAHGGALATLSSLRFAHEHKPDTSRTLQTYMGELLKGLRSVVKKTEKKYVQ